MSIYNTIIFLGFLVVILYFMICSKSTPLVRYEDTRGGGAWGDISEEVFQAIADLALRGHIDLYEKTDPERLEEIYRTRDEELDKRIEEREGEKSHEYNLRFESRRRDDELFRERVLWQPVSIDRYSHENMRHDLYRGFLTHGRGDYTTLYYKWTPDLKHNFNDQIYKDEYFALNRLEFDKFYNFNALARNHTLTEDGRIKAERWNKSQINRFKIIQESESFNIYERLESLNSLVIKHSLKGQNSGMIRTSYEFRSGVHFDDDVKLQGKYHKNFRSIYFQKVIPALSNDDEAFHRHVSNEGNNEDTFRAWQEGLLDARGEPYISVHGSETRGITANTVFFGTENRVYTLSPFDMYFDGKPGSSSTPLGTIFNTTKTILRFNKGYTNVFEKLIVLYTQCASNIMVLYVAIRYVVHETTKWPTCGVSAFWDCSTIDYPDHPYQYDTFRLAPPHVKSINLCWRIMTQARAIADALRHQRLWVPHEQIKLLTKKCDEAFKVLENLNGVDRYELYSDGKIEIPYCIPHFEKKLISRHVVDYEEFERALKSENKVITPLQLNRIWAMEAELIMQTSPHSLLHSVVTKDEQRSSGYYVGPIPDREEEVAIGRDFHMPRSRYGGPIPDREEEVYGGPIPDKKEEVAIRRGIHVPRSSSTSKRCVILEADPIIEIRGRVKKGHFGDDWESPDTSPRMNIHIWHNVRDGASIDVHVSDIWHTEDCVFMEVASTKPELAENPKHGKQLHIKLLVKVGTTPKEIMANREGWRHINGINSTFNGVLQLN